MVNKASARVGERGPEREPYMVSHRWIRLPSNLTAITKVLVQTHIQGKRRLRNSHSDCPALIVLNLKR